MEKYVSYGFGDYINVGLIWFYFHFKWICIQKFIRCPIQIEEMEFLFYDSKMGLGTETIYFY